MNCVINILFNCNDFLWPMDILWHPYDNRPTLTPARRNAVFQSRHGIKSSTDLWFRELSWMLPHQNMISNRSRVREFITEQVINLGSSCSTVMPKRRMHTCLLSLAKRVLCKQQRLCGRIIHATHSYFLLPWSTAPTWMPGLFWLSLKRIFHAGTA